MKNLFLHLMFFLLALMPTVMVYGQDVDLRDCSYGCNASDVNLEPTGAFQLIDNNGNPISESVNSCEDGDEFEVRVRLRYKVNSATRYDIRFQATLVNGDSSTFINVWIGDQLAGTYDIIISEMFTWKCGTNLSMLKPAFFWNNNNKGSNLDTSYSCDSYNQTKCFRGLEVIELIVPIELPVVWHNISATSSPDQQCAEIKWSTLKEWESSHFEIERSLNNADRFEVIDTVAASTYSFEIKEYQYVDHRIPANTTRVYYRLKQVDLDGSFEYSKVLMVNVNTREEQMATWQLFPNPAIGNDLKISLRNPRAYNGEQLHVKMISNLGVAYQMLPECLDPFEIDIGFMTKNIPNGILFVELSWGNQVEILKVIKQ